VTQQPKQTKNMATLEQLTEVLDELVRRMRISSLCVCYTQETCKKLDKVLAEVLKNYVLRDEIRMEINLKSIGNNSLKDFIIILDDSVSNVRVYRYDLPKMLAITKTKGVDTQDLNNMYNKIRDVEKKGNLFIDVWYNTDNIGMWAGRLSAGGIVDDDTTTINQLEELRDSHEGAQFAHMMDILGLARIYLNKYPTSWFGF
jgi:hypothetical protein